MTLAMKLQDERWAGREEGRAEGRAAEQIKLVKRMLSRGMSLKEISDMMDLNSEEIQKLAEHE